MKKIVFISGGIAGVILAIMLAAMVPAARSGNMDFERGALIGFTTMILAFLTIFFGIRAYRDKNNSGVISFGQAFKVGILITLVACSIYVVTWGVVYFNFIPDFGEQYAQHIIQKLEAEGASASAIQAEMVRMKRFNELYENPLFNAGITFLEVFPVGLIVTLISAAILRRPANARTSSAAVTA